MATKTTGSVEPTEKFSQDGYRSKETTTKSKSGKDSLKKIFEELLKDTYNAEQQLTNALPEMARAADSDELQEAFESHLKETEKHVQRLEKVFSRLQIEKESKTCKAMEGLIQEAQDIINEHETSPARDAAIIIASQKVEHYEIAAYGSLVELADALGLNQIADTFERTLDEEKNADALLSDIAQDVNDEACGRKSEQYA